jgi:hypothetical protein
VGGVSLCVRSSVVVVVVVDVRERDIALQVCEFLPIPGIFLLGM